MKKTLLPALGVACVLALAAPSAKGQFFGISFGHDHHRPHPHYYGHAHHYYTPYFRFQFNTPHHYSSRGYHTYPYWHRRHHW